MICDGRGIRSPGPLTRTQRRGSFPPARPRFKCRSLLSQGGQARFRTCSLSLVGRFCLCAMVGYVHCQTTRTSTILVRLSHSTQALDTHTRISLISISVTPHTCSYCNLIQSYLYATDATLEGPPSGSSCDGFSSFSSSAAASVSLSISSQHILPSVG